MNEDKSLREVELPECFERIAIALETLAETHRKLAEHFVPPVPNIVGTPYIAHQLGCTTFWITEMVKRKSLPTRCIVPGTGNGKPWKFYRDRIDAWIKSQ